jgi:hypothetical protein
MNRLPEHRSALTGRTFDRSWSPSDFDPIERPSRRERVASVVLAVVIGSGIAAMLVAWWTS